MAVKHIFYVKIVGLVVSSTCLFIKQQKKAFDLNYKTLQISNVIDHVLSCCVMSVPVEVADYNKDTSILLNLSISRKLRICNVL
jgi:hypothetical protein